MPEQQHDMQMQVHVLTNRHAHELAQLQGCAGLADIAASC